MGRKIRAAAGERGISVDEDTVLAGGQETTVSDISYALLASLVTAGRIIDLGSGPDPVSPGGGGGDSQTDWGNKAGTLVLTDADVQVVDATGALSITLGSGAGGAGVSVLVRSGGDSVTWSGITWQGSPPSGDIQTVTLIRVRSAVLGFALGAGASDPDATPVAVPSNLVTFADPAGGGSDTYTIGTVPTGVVLSGPHTTAGTYAGSGTVTITATAASGYTLTGGTYSWTHTFDTSGGATVASVILADSPEYYLPMKDAPGTTAVANLGSGSVPWTNTSGVFDGSKVLLTGDHTDLTLANTTAGRAVFGDQPAITIAFCVVISGDGFGGGYIVRSPDAFRFLIGTGGSNFGATVANAGGSGESGVAASGAPTGFPANFQGTHHAAFTYDGTNMKVYWDGALVGTTARTGTLFNNGYDQTFIGGRDPYFTNPIPNTSIKHFEICTGRALSSGRIAAIAAACLAEA